ncbi:MAG: hypothetical protein QX196_04175 [Methylococcaceae bacterium]
MIKKTLLAVALASVFSMQAEASNVNLAADSQWNTFDVDNTYAGSGGLEWIDTDGSALHFIFTLSGAADLTVVDGGFAGDQFQVFNNGTALGFTSVPVNTYPASVVMNFDAALASSNYSSAVFHLGAGSYDITGLLSLSAHDSSSIPFNATVGAVSLTAVPVPAALGLFLAGSGLIGFFSRRRDNK